MHDHCPKDQHNHRHLPEYTESKLSLIKHLGNIPKCLQIKHSVQRVDRTSCLDIIMVIHENRTVSFGRYICLHKQAVVRLKAVACIKLIFSSSESRSIRLLLSPPASRLDAICSTV